MRQERLAACTALTLFGCLGMSAAFAETQVLQGPSVGGFVSAGQTHTRFITPGLYAVTSTPGERTGIIASASAMVTLTPFPMLSLSARWSDTNPGEAAGAPSAVSLAVLTYYVEFIGPGPFVRIDLKGTAYVTQNIPGTGDASVGLFLGSEGVGSELLSYSTASEGYSTSASSYNDTTYEPTGVQISVDIEAYTAANYNQRPNFYSISAYVDPYFSIDPSNADAGAYSILISPGVGNSPGAPEASTWVMILLGFAGCAWARHRVKPAAGILVPTGWPCEARRAKAAIERRLPGPARH